MSASRADLDIQKSSNNFRDAAIIEEQAGLAKEIVAKKNKEEMNAKELKNLGITFNEKSEYKTAQEYLHAALDKLDVETLSNNEKYLIAAECNYGLATCERELGYF